MTTPTLPDDKEPRTMKQALERNISAFDCLQHLIDTHGRAQVQALLEGKSVIVPREAVSVSEATIVADPIEPRCLTAAEVNERMKEWNKRLDQEMAIALLKLICEAMLAARPGAENENLKAATVRERKYR